MQHKSPASKREAIDSNAHISGQDRFPLKGAIQLKKQNARNSLTGPIIKRDFNDFGLRIQKKRGNSVPAQIVKTLQPKRAQSLQSHPQVQTSYERSQTIKDKIKPDQGYSKWFVSAMNDLRLQWARLGPIEPLQAKQHSDKNLVAGTEEMKKEASLIDASKPTINQIEESKSASISINSKETPQDKQAIFNKLRAQREQSHETLAD